MSPPRFCRLTLNVIEREKAPAYADTHATLLTSDAEVEAGTVEEQSTTARRKRTQHFHLSSRVTAFEEESKWCHQGGGGCERFRDGLKDRKIESGPGPILYLFSERSKRLHMRQLPV
ncbi:hypothetical protein HPP92_001762 [Vanilla planifolia]|uniref:Uncharacterized protein n=1 Tax=Vanilla planifolia TaxID=51239 RepID=A0A835RYU4_VANPL|nr:hypothetical protein HPP92_001762 [Vanilla planifolia]